MHTILQYLPIKYEIYYYSLGILPVILFIVVVSIIAIYINTH